MTYIVSKEWYLWLDFKNHITWLGAFSCTAVNVLTEEIRIGECRSEYTSREPEHRKCVWLKSYWLLEHEKRNHLTLNCVRAEKPVSIYTFVTDSTLSSAQWHCYWFASWNGMLVSSVGSYCKDITWEFKVCHRLNLSCETLLLMHADGLMVLPLSLTPSHFRNAVPRDYFLWLQSRAFSFSCGLFFRVMPFFFFLVSLQNTKILLQWTNSGRSPPKLSLFSLLPLLSFPRHSEHSSRRRSRASPIRLETCLPSSVHISSRGGATLFLLALSFHTTSLANLNSSERRWECWWPRCSAALGCVCFPPAGVWAGPSVGGSGATSWDRN